MALNPREVIRASRIFRQLSDVQIDRLAKLCQEESYEAGVAIFNEGEPAAKFYLVAEGRVALEMELRIGARSRRRMATDVLKVGDVVGFTALTFTPVHGVSGVCIEKTRLLAFDGEAVRQLCSEDFALYRAVTNQIITLVQRRSSNTTETLARVLAVASHDLKAPLATIQSCIDLVCTGIVGEISEKQKELLTGAKQRASDLTKTINNLLDISQIQISKEDFASLSLPELVQVCIGNVSGLSLRKNVKIENRLSAKLPQVVGSASRLQKVMDNLLSNAVKFNVEGGFVTVSAQQKGSYVQTDVADTGVGIPPAELPKLFADFYRGVQTDVEGAGIGLSVARRIVEAHGGRIWAESPCPETGIGSKFCFTIPVSGATMLPKGEEKPDIRCFGARILVADDDPALLKVTTAVLEAAGYSMVTARDGAEAIEKIEEDEPDAVVLDLLMPKMDGFEVCKWLWEREQTTKRHIPTLIASAVGESSGRRRYELETKSSWEVDEYLEKPVSASLLVRKVDNLLKKWSKGAKNGEDVQEAKTGE